MSTWENVDTPEMDGGDSFTTLHMSLVPLNRALENGGNGQCHVMNILQ